MSPIVYNINTQLLKIKWHLLILIWTLVNPKEGKTFLVM